MLSLFNQFKMILMAGNGGTGKTTVSATMAMMAAESGKRVALLTIDPSRRLGSLFNMDLNKDHLSQQKVGAGTLDVYLLQSQSVILEFIRARWGESEAESLQKNPIFRQVASTLSENQSLSTIYKLAQILESNYDIVFVDTPPAHHTVDFFKSPQGVIDLFRDNIFAKMIQEKRAANWWSGGLLLRIFGFLLGKDFVEQMSGFFSILSQFQIEMVAAAEKMQTYLKQENACYFMVTLLEPNKAVEIQQTLQELAQQNIRVQNVIVNRAYPLGLNLEALPPIGDEQLLVYYRRDWEYYHRHSLEFNEVMKKNNTIKNIFYLPERFMGDVDFDWQPMAQDLQIAMGTNQEF